MFQPFKFSKSLLCRCDQEGYCPACGAYNPHAVPLELLVVALPDRPPRADDRRWNGQPITPDAED